MLHLFSPSWKNPFGAQEPLRMKNTILNFSVQNINRHHIRVHGIWVFPPCSLCHGFPGVATKRNKTILKSIRIPKKLEILDATSRELLGKWKQCKVIRTEETENIT